MTDLVFTRAAFLPLLFLLCRRRFAVSQIDLFPVQFVMMEHAPLALLQH